MSEHIVRIIPKGVGELPITTKAEIENLFRDMGIVYKVLSVTTYDQITFIDCGKNLEYIRCPYCHGDALKWWGSVMAMASSNDFSNRHVITPCCERSVMLENMDYCLDMGFARFVIEVQEPETIITNSDLYELGIEIGCDMKKILVRY